MKTTLKLSMAVFALLLAVACDKKMDKEKGSEASHIEGESLKHDEHATHEGHESSKHETHDEHGDHESHSDHPTAEGDHGHGEKVKSLHLDEGKRWKADAETTKGMANLVKILHSFSQSGDKASCVELSKDLKQEFNSILNKCTMQGEAHNQLHEYLVPMITLFDTIASAEQKGCQTQYTELKSHLDQYQKYFE